MSMLSARIVFISHFKEMEDRRNSGSSHELRVYVACDIRPRALVLNHSQRLLSASKIDSCARYSSLLTVYTRLSTVFRLPLTLVRFTLPFCRHGQRP